MRRPSFSSLWMVAVCEPSCAAELGAKAPTIESAPTTVIARRTLLNIMPRLLVEEESFAADADEGPRTKDQGPFLMPSVESREPCPRRSTRAQSRHTAADLVRPWEDAPPSSRARSRWERRQRP